MRHVGLGHFAPNGATKSKVTRSYKHFAPPEQREPQLSPLCPKKYLLSSLSSPRFLASPYRQQRNGGDVA